MREEALASLALRVDVLEAKGPELGAVLLEARRMEQRVDAATQQVQRRADLALTALAQRLQSGEPGACGKGRPQG